MNKTRTGGHTEIVVVADDEVVIKRAFLTPAPDTGQQEGQVTVTLTVEEAEALHNLATWGVNHGDLTAVSAYDKLRAALNTPKAASDEN